MKNLVEEAKREMEEEECKEIVGYVKTLMGLINAKNRDVEKKNGEIDDILLLLKEIENDELDIEQIRSKIYPYRTTNTGGIYLSNTLLG